MCRRRAAASAVGVTAGVARGSRGAAGHGTSKIPWPDGLPVYDHVVIVMEENKAYDQVIGSPDAPYINDTLKKEGANLVKMFAEEHKSEGNYFWLFSGSNQDVGFKDEIPAQPITAHNLGEQLIAAGLSFKGYSEDLPAIGATDAKSGQYARKHAPWISFANVPNGTTRGRLVQPPLRGLSERLQQAADCRLCRSQPRP